MRLFRVLCLLAAVVCLGVIAPINLLQNLHWSVHGGNVLLGVLGLFCYRESLRGRQHQLVFLTSIAVVLDVLWFSNGGALGSIPVVFLPLAIFVIAAFSGRMRLGLLLALTLNLAGLYLVEWWRPEWILRYHNPQDQFIDLMTGEFTTLIFVVFISALMLRSYESERRRQIELKAQLAVSEKNYREIFNSTGDALLVFASDDRILDVNDQACELFGAGRERLLGHKAAELSAKVVPYSSAEIEDKLDLARQGHPQLFEWRSQRISGGLFWSEIALRGWAIGQERRVIAAIRDISPRKHVADALRLNEERLRLAMEASRQGWFELNLLTGESNSSPEYIRLLGYEAETFQSNYSAWTERIHPADREAALQAFQAGITSGQNGVVEYRQRTKTGDWKWIRSLAKVVERTPDGRPLRMIGTHMDITERKEMERQLLHSQRVEAVGTLASGVAHDLNNILTPMLMASGILRHKLLDAKDRELMTLLDEGGRRGAAIVRQLLAFSRNLEQDRLLVDPREVLREISGLMRATFPKEIRIVEEFATDVGVVEADPNQLHQVVMNLCVNARDAMPTGGCIRLGLIRTGIPKQGEAAPYVEISVTDTGEGIPAENLDRIFDPFFTTKPLGQGTGLGLATVHGIVKAHHGLVRVESQLRQGTTFRVFLPVQEPGPAPAPASPPVVTESVETIPPKSGRILLVDDEPAVLQMTARKLEQLGYRVLTAGGGKEALATLTAAGGGIALVVTDFSMPEIDGPTLAAQLLQIAPSLRIIGVSGLEQESRLTELQAIGFHEVLRKPYESDQLVAAVKRQIARAAPPA